MGVRPAKRLITAGLSAALAAGLLAGCLGGGAPSESLTSAGGGRAGAEPDAPAPTQDKGGAGAQQAAPISDAALARREVAYTADLAIRVGDVAKAVFDVEAVTERAGGYVANSLTTNADAGHVPGGTPDSNEAHLRVQVPPDRFNDVLAAVSRLGSVESRNLSAEDKTSEVVDVESRIADQRKSIARVRQIMDRARTLADVVTLESELSRREAELGALLARQATLAAQTQLASIILTLRGPAVAASSGQLGFLSGLRSGWHAFVTAVSWALTVLGAMLPFLVALLVLGAPLVWAVRRARPRRATSEQS